MDGRYIELPGSYLASLCEQAGYSAESISHWRSFGSRMIEVRRAEVNLAMSAAGIDVIPRDVPAI